MADLDLLDQQADELGASVSLVQQALESGSEDAVAEALKRYSAAADAVASNLLPDGDVEGDWDEGAEVLARFGGLLGVHDQLFRAVDAADPDPVSPDPDVVRGIDAFGGGFDFSASVAIQFDALRGRRPEGDALRSLTEELTVRPYVGTMIDQFLPAFSKVGLNYITGFPTEGAEAFLSKKGGQKWDDLKAAISRWKTFLVDMARRAFEWIERMLSAVIGEDNTKKLIDKVKGYVEKVRDGIPHSLGLAAFDAEDLIRDSDLNLAAAPDGATRLQRISALSPAHKDALTKGAGIYEVCFWVARHASFLGGLGEPLAIAVTLVRLGYLTWVTSDYLDSSVMGLELPHSVVGVGRLAAGR